METIIPILAAIIVLGFLGYRLYRKRISGYRTLNQQAADDVDSMPESADISDGQTRQDTTDKREQEQEKPDTIGLMFKTLSNIGCQPVKNDDGTLTVSYQGENFFMEFGGSYARIWDPNWEDIKEDNPDMPKVREAVNAANFNFGPTVVLTRPNDEGIIRFHTRRDIMLHPACPDNEPFVKAVLESFFDAKEDVRRYFQQMKTNQHEAPQSRRPVGFATDINDKENNH